MGGGASAVCLLDALAQEGGVPPGEVVVFEPSGHLWRGRPYQPDLDVVRVNAIPEDMSVRAGDTGHFGDWLVGRTLITSGAGDYLDLVSGARFVPRALFGDYLEQSARAALCSLASAGWQVRIVRDHVVRAAAEGSAQLLLVTSAGVEVTVDHAVLCFGAGKPVDVFGLTGTEGFVAEPYPTSSALANLDEDADVVVIGTGLTGVDVALALDRLGHRGRVRLLSRRGVLPGVRQRPIHHKLRHFTPQHFRRVAAAGGSLTLPQVVALMETELRSVGETLSPIRAELAAIAGEDPVARLRRGLGEVDSPSIAIRVLQQAVPDAGPDVWPLLDEAARTWLMAEHDRTLMSLCCPMPPASAARLLALVEAGRLEFVRGVTDVRARPGGGFAMTADGVESSTQVVVNAVNARLHRRSGAAAPLVASLAAEGLAEPHPRGGVHVLRATSELVTGDVPDPRLFALGDPARGSLFFTFGVQSLVDRAVDIVESVRAHWATPALVHPGRSDDDRLQLI
ncbi:FAD/NAD(P)-binding protein [Saccharothrix longispora]|uniref:FAD/NAD(P)-binding protein n=1 Tax=Saccharothrix longispora TaxID=33920 RepID=UPI0028FD42FE|nr:FAD/NAD(P)-binding protein [Saccharothrix longispora]MDU0290759.1 FAD/NAD(P)-binding protein [Saccharothrix longispora]